MTIPGKSVDKNIYKYEAFAYSRITFGRRSSCRMASSSLGLFGDYKYSRSRGKKTPPSLETVWVSRPYDPLDERDSAPVPQTKIINKPRNPSELPPEWVSGYCVSCIRWSRFETNYWLLVRPIIYGR